MNMNDLLNAANSRIDALEKELNETKAMLADAVGDGFYDGYLQCQAEVKKEIGSDFSTVSEMDECEILELSEDYESNHRYAKSLIDLKTDFGNQIHQMLIEASGNSAENGYHNEAVVMSDAANLVYAEIESLKVTKTIDKDNK